MADNAPRSVQVRVDVEEALFDASDSAGHTLTMDMAGKLGLKSGRAFAARDLLLAALAGCSGASFLAELKRREQKLSDLNIELSGELDTKPPLVFRKIRMHFVVTGEGLEEEALQAAAFACHGDCSIHATLSQVAAIETTYESRELPVAAGA